MKFIVFCDNLTLKKLQVCPETQLGIEQTTHILDLLA